jgi:hypothetical protein
MNVQDLQLLEVLDFDRNEGLITFRDQRMLIQGAGAMGLLGRNSSRHSGRRPPGGC